MTIAPDSNRDAPIGILGGTFDPIHFGHLRLAEESCETLGLARVLLIPSGQPPHRAAPATPAKERLAMARLAAEDNAAMEVDAIEVNAATPSYTVHTLERLRERYGAARPLVLLLGADAFAGLTTWHRWQNLFDLAHLAIANRPGHPSHARHLPELLSDALAAHCNGRFADRPEALCAAPSGLVLPFEMTPLAISASLIRSRLSAGRTVRYLIPDSVLDYIQSHHLYT